mmetsp:Transcript_2540/g.9819  ORF Transcript_2540/g.9819 Transcript_2540/m.9819 type:complete len:207 (+) Transcript_2540:1870-2490(+)
MPMSSLFGQTIRFTSTFFIKFVNSFSMNGNAVMSPPISRRLKLIVGFPMNATCIALNEGHQSHKGPNTIRTTPKNSTFSIAIGRVIPMNWTSNCTSGSVAAHLASMSNPTSLGTSVTVLIDTNTNGDVPSVNFENRIPTPAPATRRFKIGSTLDTTELEMARFRNGHHTAAALFSHATRSRSGNVIHLGNQPIIFTNVFGVKIVWS